MNKIKLSLLLVPLLVIAAGTVPTSPTPITLAWDGSTGQVDAYVIYTRDSMASGNWLMLTNVPGTQTSVTFSTLPRERFYVCTASNFWGESDFSNVASTPAPPTGGNLTIRRGN